MIALPLATHTAPGASRVTCGGTTPAERLLRGEANTLAAYELLSTVLEPGLGRERAHTAAIRLLCGISGEGLGPLRKIGKAQPEALQELGGLTPAATARLIAALELGRRFSAEPAAERRRLGAAEDIYGYFNARLRDVPCVEYWVVALTDGCEVVNEAMVSRGSCPVPLHGRDVLRPALIEGVGRFVLVHNDPSTRRPPRPSDADRHMTMELADAAAIVGLVLWDHVIIGLDGYRSYRDDGLLTSKRRSITGARGTAP